MTRSPLVFSVVSMLALPSGTAAAQPQMYTIDPTRSRIVVHVGKAGLFGFAGHVHEVIAPVNRGAVVVDPVRLEASSVDLEVDARALRVTGRDEPRDDVPKVQQTMLGPNCLDAGRFPEIRFVSKAISATRPASGGLDAKVSGVLTLHGVSRDLGVQVHVDLGSDLVDAKATVTLRQTDFGIQPVSVAGVVKVKDEVQIELRLVARRAR